MKIKENTTVFIAEKAIFETPVIEIIQFTTNDVITTSGGFPGDDDPIIST